MVGGDWVGEMNQFSPLRVADDVTPSFARECAAMLENIAEGCGVAREELYKQFGDTENTAGFNGMQGLSSYAADTLEKVMATTPEFEVRAEPCSMGVGCEDAAGCYAEARGEPHRCPRAQETCPYCGMKGAYGEICDAPPVDTCERALNALAMSRATTPMPAKLIAGSTPGREMRFAIVPDRELTPEDYEGFKAAFAKHDGPIMLVQGESVGAVTDLNMPPALPVDPYAAEEGEVTAALMSLHSQRVGSQDLIRELRKRALQGDPLLQSVNLENLPKQNVAIAGPQQSKPNRAERRKQAKKIDRLLKIAKKNGARYTK